MIHPCKLSENERGTQDGSLSTASVAGGDLMCERILPNAAASVSLYSGHRETIPAPERCSYQVTATF